MAWELDVKDVTYEAGEDLSADQFRFVVLDATTKKVRRPDSATERPEGVLQNAPKAGQAASVRGLGYSKLRAGDGNLAMNALVGIEYVSAADAGKGVLLGAGQHRAYAVVAEPCDAEDELATVLVDAGGLDKKQVSVPLPAFTANATVITGLLNVRRPVKVLGISVSAKTKPSDADGTCLLALYNHDKSAAAEDALLTAAKDLETLAAAGDSEDLALTATAADLLLDAGDSVYADQTNNSAAIDTNLAGGVVTIDYVERDA